MALVPSRAACLSKALATIRYRRVLLDKPNASAVLLLRGGVYEISAPLRFGPDDAGLTVRSFPGETATLSAGRTLSFTFTRDKTVAPGVARYVASLPAGLVQATQVFDEQGERLVRARCRGPRWRWGESAASRFLD